MIEFFDTTVLMAAMVEDEARHESCAEILASVRDGHAAAHSLAERYATLSSLLNNAPGEGTGPTSWRISQAIPVGRVPPRGVPGVFQQAVTGGRLGIHLSPGDAAALVRHNVHDRLSLVTLSAQEYLKLVEAAGPAGARGGTASDL